jgi:hypothetical protein
MRLRNWQRRLVDRYPFELLRGLIHSDGCRSMNHVRRRSADGVREYAYPRYYFVNASPEIRDLFTSTCSQVGVRWRRMTERTISVARRDSVAFLDTFIVPKS